MVLDRRAGAGRHDRRRGRGPSAARPARRRPGVRPRPPGGARGEEAPCPAARLAGGDDARAFYAETAQALEGYAADKLDTSAAGIIRDELLPALDARGAHPGTVDEFFAVLEACDRQRFAPVDAEIEERRAFLARAEAVLSALAREIG